MRYLVLALLFCIGTAGAYGKDRRSTMAADSEVSAEQSIEQVFEQSGGGSFVGGGGDEVVEIVRIFITHSGLVDRFLEGLVQRKIIDVPPEKIARLKKLIRNIRWASDLSEPAEANVVYITTQDEVFARYNDQGQFVRQASELEYAQDRQHVRPVDTLNLHSQDKRFYSIILNQKRWLEKIQRRQENGLLAHVMHELFGLVDLDRDGTLSQQFLLFLEEDDVNQFLAKQKEPFATGTNNPDGLWVLMPRMVQGTLAGIASETPYDALFMDSSSASPRLKQAILELTTVQTINSQTVRREVKLIQRQLMSSGKNANISLIVSSKPASSDQAASHQTMSDQPAKYVFYDAVAIQQSLGELYGPYESNTFAEAGMYFQLLAEFGDRPLIFLSEYIFVPSRSMIQLKWYICPVGTQNIALECKPWEFESVVNGTKNITVKSVIFEVTRAQPGSAVSSPSQEH